jgi:hypothetical protein
MAYSIGDLVVRILGEDADFQKKIKGVDKEADKASKSVGKSFDVMKVKSIAMGVASAAAIVKTIDFLKDSAMVAIDAQETFGKFDVVFQGMGSAAETAAKQFQDSFGLAEVTAKSMLSATGDLLSGLGMTGDAALDMSVQVNTLASDLASFTNFSGGAEGASAALTKALLGERESVKALGIVIREEDVQQRLAAAGKDKLTGAALLQAKAEATLKIALEQSKNAIGDYARTSDSASNTLKRAKEASLELQVALGTALSPSVSLLGELWGTVASELAKVIQQSNELKAANQAINEGTATSKQYIIAYTDKLKDLEAERQAAWEAGAIQTDELDEQIRTLEKELYVKQQMLKVETEANRGKEQQKKEEENINALREERAEKEAAEKERLLAIDQRKIDIDAELKAKQEELNFMVQEGLMSETEQRTALEEAYNNQISSLYELYQQTGDKTILASEAMQTAIANVLRLGQTTTTVSQKMIVDWTNITEKGIQGALAGFNELGVAMANGELSWSSFGKMGLKVIADTIRAVAAEMAAFAALEIAKAGFFNPIGWAASAGTLALSAGLYTSAGIIEGLAANMATGGIAEPTGGGAIVRVAENDAAEVMFNTGESGQAFISQMGAAIAREFDMTAVFQVNDEKLAEVVVKPINDGKVRMIK